MAEETILTGDDIMLGPPSPVVPPEVASHVLDGLETCSAALRRLFLCKLIHLSLVWSKQNDCFCSLFASVLELFWEQCPSLGLQQHRGASL